MMDVEAMRWRMASLALTMRSGTDEGKDAGRRSRVAYAPMVRACSLSIPDEDAASGHPAYPHRCHGLLSATPALEPSDLG
jgi:hypothetical protein